MTTAADLRGLPAVFRKLKTHLDNILTRLVAAEDKLAGTTALGAAPLVTGLKDASGNYIWASGTAVPGAVAGYAKGCIFVDTDSSDHSDLLYANIGDATTANFNLVTVAADA